MLWEASGFIFIHEWLLCGSNLIDENALLLCDIPHMLHERLPDFRVLELPSVSDAYPVRNPLGKQWEKLVEEFVGRAKVACLHVLVDHVLDKTTCNGVTVGFGELRVQPVFDCGFGSSVSWHLFY